MIAFDFDPGLDIRSSERAMFGLLGGTVRVTAKCFTKFNQN